MDPGASASSSSTPRPLWKTAAAAASLWLVVCAIAGFLVSALIGEHGSVIFAMFGLVVGVAGAVSHVLLLFLPRFRAWPQVIQVVSVWAGAIVLLLIIGAIAAAQSERPYVLAFSEALSVVVLYCAPAALLGAVAFVRLVKSAA